MKAHKIEEDSMKNDQPTRIALLEQTNSHIYETLERMEKRFDRVDESIKQMNGDINSLRIEMVKNIHEESKYNGNRSWLQFGFLFTLIAAVLGILAQAEGWV